MHEIHNQNLRVLAFEKDGRYWLEFECRGREGSWRTVLATGVASTRIIWSLNPILICEDPLIEWKTEGEDNPLQKAEGFFSQATVDAESQVLTLSGQAGCHAVEERITIQAGNRIHITVRDRLAAPAGTLSLARLMSHFYFVPDKKIARAVEPLDFAWLPALHKRPEHICSDHFFRSPAIIVQAEGTYAAVIPDLDLFATHRTVQHALDLRVTETKVEAPRLSYGICPAVLDGHVYFKHDDEDTEVVNGTELYYGFDLFLGQTSDPEEAVSTIRSYLWETYGHHTFQDVRPQVLPFEEYGRRYTYVHELPKSIRKVTIDGEACAGIHNPHRRGANFHAWENDLHVGYGIWHYAEKWNDDVLREVADGILQLSLCAPRKNGAFPCIYNFAEEAYEGTLFWTARCADPFHGYDSAAMSVSAWWQLYWYQDLQQKPGVLESVVSYARFLKEAQLPSGAIPTYFFSDLKPAKQLLESATTAINGAVLAECASLTGDAELRQAAISAGRFVEEKIIPELVFNDFETYYSCSPKPLHAIDYWTGIRPHNNLSIQWACDQFLALYRLTGEERWLRKGEYLLSILSLYQQVWNPSHLDGYLFGGFGVMNTDGEWNDGRQARFVPTYADYYEATGKIEYLERAGAACRASFALMDIPENHANEINAITMMEGPGLGYAPENIHHMGNGSAFSWTGMNWSSGGGLAASAYLERHFGGVWVDGQTRTAIPIDGTAASINFWDGPQIHLTVASALSGLPAPHSACRGVVVKFGRLSASQYAVSINGKPLREFTREELGNGITLQI